MREDSRANNQLRDVQIVKDFTMHPEGSVLITMGNTKVICTASIEEKVPYFFARAREGLDYS